VLWPRHLCEELAPVGEGLLYGYFIAPANPSLSPYCTAVVIGAVAAPPPLARQAQADALARPHVPPKHDQWRIQLRVLGTWHATEAGAAAAAAAAEAEEAGADGEAAAARDSDDAAVLDPPLLLLHAWGGRTHSPAASNFSARVQLPALADWRLPRMPNGGGRGDRGDGGGSSSFAAVASSNGGIGNGIIAAAAADASDHHHHHTHHRRHLPDLQLFGYTLPREGHGHILLSSNALGGSAAAAPWLAPRPAVAQQPPPATCFVMGDLVAPWPWLQPVQGASALEMAVACANRAEAASRAVAIALRGCNDGGSGSSGVNGGRSRDAAPAPCAVRHALIPSFSSSCWWGTDRAALERRLWFRLCSGGGAGCLARRPLEPALLSPPPVALSALLPWWWPWRRPQQPSARRRGGEGAAAAAAGGLHQERQPDAAAGEPLSPVAAAAAMARWAASLAVHASSTGRFAARKLRAYRRGATTSSSSAATAATAAAAAAAARAPLPAPAPPQPPPPPLPPFALTAAQRWDAAALNAARLHTERDVSAELAQHACGLVAGLLLACFAPALGSALARACARLCSPEGGPLAAVVAWLASAAPGGVKLHAELALLLGAAVRGVLAAAATLYASDAGAALLTATAFAVAAASAAFGLSAGLAAAADAAGLMAWPVGLAYAGLALLYSLQRRAIAVTWGLMRGAGTANVVAAAQAVAARRRRRQRQRQQQQQQQQQQLLQQQRHSRQDEAASAGGPVLTAAVSWDEPAKRAEAVDDAAAAAATAAAPPAPSQAGASAGGAAGGDEVAAEHLIVGVLLFTPLIALLPTTAAFYAAAALAHGATAALRLALLELARQLVLNPLAYAAARRALTPRLFPGDLSVAALRPVAPLEDEARRRRERDGRPAPRCYLLGNRPLHYSQLLAPALGGADGARAQVVAAGALRAFGAGRLSGFLL